MDLGDELVLLVAPEYSVPIIFGYKNGSCLGSLVTASRGRHGARAH